VRSKDRRENEAYVRVQLPTAALIDDADCRRCDRIGQQIVSIAQGALNIDYIKGFYHLGKEYKFDGRSLII
jgi:hypothetical protein